MTSTAAAETRRPTDGAPHRKSSRPRDNRAAEREAADGMAEWLAEDTTRRAVAGFRL